MKNTEIGYRSFFKRNKKKKFKVPGSKSLVISIPWHRLLDLWRPFPKVPLIEYPNFTDGPKFIRTAFAHDGNWPSIRSKKKRFTFNTTVEGKMAQTACCWTGFLAQMESCCWCCENWGQRASIHFPYSRTLFARHSAKNNLFCCFLRKHLQSLSPVFFFFFCYESK